MNPPSDYNPYIHGKAPVTRVERLAWKHKLDSDFPVRSAAAAILIVSKCLHYHSCSPHLTRQVPVALRRHRIATAAWNLRRNLSCHGFKPVDTRQLIQPPIHEDSARMERTEEARTIKGTVNFKG